MRKIFSVLLICLISISAFGQSNKKAMKAGKSFMDNQRYDDAVGQFTSAIQLNPTDIKAYIARGEAYEKLEKYQESYDDYEKARVFDPKNISSGTAPAYSPTNWFRIGVGGLDESQLTASDIKSLSFTGKKVIILLQLILK